jgi:hypothetical protein
MADDLPTWAFPGDMPDDLRELVGAFWGISRSPFAETQGLIEHWGKEHARERATATAALILMAQSLSRIKEPLRSQMVQEFPAALGELLARYDLASKRGGLGGMSTLH